MNHSLDTYIPSTRVSEKSLPLADVIIIIIRGSIAKLSLGNRKAMRIAARADQRNLMMGNQFA